MRIDSLLVERDIIRRVLKGRNIPDVYLETRFPLPREGESHVTFLKRTVSAVRRLVRNHMPEDEAERLRFIAEMLGIEESDIVVLGARERGTPIERLVAEAFGEEPDDEAIRLVMATLEPGAVGENRVVRLPYPEPHEDYTDVHAHLYRRMRPAYHRTARKFRHSEGGYHPIVDLESYLAEASLLRALRRYVEEEPERLPQALFEWRLRGGAVDIGNLSDEAVKTLAKMAPAYGVGTVTGRWSNDAWTRLLSAYAEEGGDVFAAGSFRDPLRGLAPLVIKFATDLADLRERVKDAMAERAEYATAFQTKKHIPQTHQARMEDNRFLDVYGYVELDEDVDLEKFTAIEADLVRFVEATGMRPAPDHAFRVRRLGRYKAAGIYFSAYKTTAFDLRHPSSFGHEWMHQVDFTALDGKTVSETARFQPLYMRYREVVSEAIKGLPKDDPVGKAWRGSTKYNRDYYLKKTEVFARLGELYLAEVVGDNSLLQRDGELRDSPVHPDDPVTMDLVRTYFGELFGKISPVDNQNVS